MPKFNIDFSSPIIPPEIQEEFLEFLLGPRRRRPPVSLPPVDNGHFRLWRNA